VDRCAAGLFLRKIKAGKARPKAEAGPDGTWKEAWCAAPAALRAAKEKNNWAGVARRPFQLACAARSSPLILILLILSLRPLVPYGNQISSRSDHHSVSLPGVSTGYREISPALLQPGRAPVIDDKLNISGTVQPV